MLGQPALQTPGIGPNRAMRIEDAPMAVGSLRTDVDARKSPIPKELTGQIRQFAERLAPNFLAARKRVLQVLRPLTETARTKRPSAWLICETARRWREATADDERILFMDAEYHDGTWTFGEDRAVPADLHLWNWEDDDYEAGFSLVRWLIEVDARHVREESAPYANLSWHAVGRRLERGGGSIREALRDTRDVMPWVRTHDLCSSQPPIIVPTPTGHWRGFVGLTEDDEADMIALPTLRTWLPDETIEDATLCADLTELRCLGPVADAKAVVTRVLARIGRAEKEPVV